VMEDERANYQVFNVGGGQAVTVLGFGKLVAEALDVTLTPKVPGEFRFGDTRHIISDITKLKSLGWSPQVPLSEIIRRYIDWAVTQPGVGDYYTSAEQVMKKMGTVRSVSP
jgi:dTDP-L-rhamnose 4-epimerase